MKKDAPNHYSSALTRLATVTLTLLTSLVMVAAGSAVASAAVIDCTNGVTFSGNGFVPLNNDYIQNVSTGISCITLENGADLDLNGHTLTCNSGLEFSCNVAIEATATGSIVKNTQASEGLGGIVSETPLNRLSTWGTAVLNVEEVRDLKIAGAFVGIVNGSVKAKKISGNAITDVVECIRATLKANTSSIQNNFCSPDLQPIFSPEGTGITATGTSSGNGAKIKRNLILNANIGIFGSQRLRIDDNINCDEDDGNGGQPQISIYVDATAGQTGSHNLCCNISTLDELAGVTGCTFPGQVLGGFSLWP